VADATAAEDVVQEAFLRLAVETAAGDGPRNHRAWLHRVVLNLIISGTRHTKVATRMANRLATADVAYESPEILFLDSERHRALRAALRATGPDARRGLVLAAHGYSGREIAESIGRTEGATRTLLCRARTDVRRQLEASYPEVA
jgi:RNA polymerase sigma-70 factor, ECF subfamily